MNPEGGTERKLEPIKVRNGKIIRKKKKVLGQVLCYANTRILIDTIATYVPVYERQSGASMTKHGISFVLRNGETQCTMGDDEVQRDKVIAWLDAHFEPVKFYANQCQVCTHRDDEDFCNTNSCREYNGHKSFEREK
jgi:hypothetical protein